MRGMDAAELHPWLKLAHAPGIGPVRANELLRRFGSPAAVCKASHDELRHAGVHDAAARFLRGDGDAAIDKELEWQTQPDNHLVTQAHEHYPQRLLGLSDAPTLLYVAGDPEVLDTLQLAMVGSRNATAYGLSTARRLSRELAALGITVVSGMAVGIDTAAHEGALEAGGKTIAVLGSGLLRLYPKQNLKLAQRIAASGAVTTEFSMVTGPEAHNFPARNRIISGISLGTVVVEASRKSGSLITARLALEQNTAQEAEISGFGGSGQKVFR